MQSPVVGLSRHCALLQIYQIQARDAEFFPCGEGSGSIHQVCVIDMRDVDYPWNVTVTVSRGVPRTGAQQSMRSAQRGLLLFRRHFCAEM